MEWHRKERLRLTRRGRGRLGWDASKNPGDDKDVYQRDLKKEEPAEAHELVVAETRQRPTDPHEHKDQGGDFCKEDRNIDETENPTMRSIRDARKMPAANKQSHDESCPGDHPCVFAEKKQREFHRRIFSVITAG